LCTSSSVIGTHGAPFPRRARHTTPPVDGLSFARADGGSRSRLARSADDPTPVASREDGPAGDARPPPSAGSPREEARQSSTCGLMSCFETCASHTGHATYLDFVSARRRWPSADAVAPDCRRFMPRRRDAHGWDARAARIWECRLDAFFAVGTSGNSGRNHEKTSQQRSDENATASQTSARDGRGRRGSLEPCVTKEESIVPRA
jgi:hypothetical protein